MNYSRLRSAVPVVALAAAFAAGAVYAAETLHFSEVKTANTKVVGQVAPNILPPELMETPVAQGAFKLENPAVATVIPVGCPANATAGVGFYGYDSDGPLAPAFGSNVEATKTEPDENTYLILRNLHGFDPNYNYGTHFLYQGHELGRGYITRVNLDADGAHRVTLMATTDSNGCPLPTIDGSTWYPFSERLLFTSESGGDQSIVQATPDYPSTVVDLTSQIGLGAYEGVVPDKWGRIILVEDAGGNTGSTTSGTVTDGSGTVTPAPPVDLSHTKPSNSFVYRFLPYLTGDLTQGGILQVLQVESGSFAAPGAPITFTTPASGSQHNTQVAANHDLLSPNLSDLHTYGKTFKTKWITIHDTTLCPTPKTCTPWNANTLAKSMGGTPFKRPENGRFRPGTDFSEFYFDETGDTDNRTAGPAYGGFGAIYKLQVEAGKLSLLYNAPDAVHAGFDNASFLDDKHVVFVEDAGDTLHTQRNALDSAWVFDVTADYSNPANQPKRFEAEGRDASATIDSGLSGSAGFQNEGDNEITGFILSNGDPDKWDGILGSKTPEPFEDGWRMFYTQQHGDNFTWEILPARADKDNDHDRDDRRFDRDDRR